MHLTVWVNFYFFLFKGISQCIDDLFRFHHRVNQRFDTVLMHFAGIFRQVVIPDNTLLRIRIWRGGGNAEADGNVGFADAFQKLADDLRAVFRLAKVGDHQFQVQLRAAKQEGQRPAGSDLAEMVMPELRKQHRQQRNGQQQPDGEQDDPRDIEEEPRHTMMIA